MVKTALANSAWWLSCVLPHALFLSALDDPSQAQEQLLLRNIRANSDTAFGRAHGFADIRSIGRFCRNVPVRDFDAMLPWIERLRQGEAAVLTREPVKRLIPTSGSTSARKLIPWTRSMQRELNRAIGPWIFDLFCRHPAAMTGPAYWSITPMADQSNARAERSVVPVGFDADADYLGGWRKKLVDAVMAAPAAVGRIGSMEAWRYVTLLMLLQRKDLSLISIWHPSFLELLLNALKPLWPTLVADIATGRCSINENVSPAILRPLGLRADSRRSAELASVGPHDWMRLWPRLRVISCWCDGHAALAATGLREKFPGIAVQEKGLLATEGIVSIPFAGVRPLAIRSHFLEFEDANGRILIASELRAGEIYGVLLTTMGGLYRYRLNDLIFVDGHLGQTPTIRFVGKSGLVSDRAGEKLSDGFVAQVIRQFMSRYSATPTFIMLAPDQDFEGCRYTLYLDADLPETAAADLDLFLSANPQYAHCRRLGQLLAPRLFRLAGEPYRAYCARLVGAGQRLGDIKPAALSRLDGWSNHFSKVNRH